MARMLPLLALLLAAAGAAGAAEAPRARSYIIDATFRPREAAMQATATVGFAAAASPVDTLVFYLHGELRVTAVEADGEALPVEQGLVLYPFDYSCIACRAAVLLSGRALPRELTVRYEGPLHPSAARSPSDYMRVGPEGVLLRSYGYSLWFPVFLESGRDGHSVETVEVTIHTPAGFPAVVTGQRLGETVSDSTCTSRWRAEDVDLFAIQCAARRWVPVHEDGCYAYALADSQSRAAADSIIAFARRLQDLYRRHYRPAAAGGQLHVMQMPRYGNISSGNVVGVDDEIWRGFAPASRTGRVLAHELVHPHVQVPVPRGDECHALVIEGFPSYLHLPAMAAILGEAYYDEVLDRVAADYRRRRETGRDRRGEALPPEKPLLAITADEIGVYKDRFVLNDRALLFFDWIRRELGAAGFFAFTRDLLSREALEFAEIVSALERHRAGSREDVRLWLRTTDYPPRLWREPEE